MPRKDCDAVPEGNCPISQQEEFGSGEPTLADIYRLSVEGFDRLDDRWNKKLDEISDEMRKMDQHVTRLGHRARQPRLAMEADGHAATKTRERTEGTATAVQAMRGDCFSARRVEPGPNTNSTSFGVKAEPPALPCRDNVVVECGAAASESCLPSLEMRPSTAAGGLVPSGKASIASETTSNEPRLRFYVTEEMNPEGDSKMEDSWTLTSSALHDSRSFLRLFAASYCHRIVETKSRQNRIQVVQEVTSVPAYFWDPGTRWFVARFHGLGQLKNCSVFSEEIRWFFEKRPVLIPCQEKVSPSRAARGYMNSREEQRSRRHGDSR